VIALEYVVDLYDESIKMCIDLFRFGVVIANEMVERTLVVDKGQSDWDDAHHHDD
jgi:hypothetical protein